MQAPDTFADAHGYERFMGRWSQLAAPLLVDFARIPHHGTILDLGCGTGSLAFAIARLRPHCEIVGVDRSSDYIAFAQSKSQEGRVRFEAADARKLPFQAGTFDAAASLFVFNFIPDPAKALAETRRVTRPGAYISAAVWDYGQDMQMLRLFWDAVSKLDRSAERLDERHMPLCRKGELAELWTQENLCDVKESRLELTMKFEDYDAFWTPFLLGQGPAGAYIKCVGADCIVALREELRRMLDFPKDGFVLPARLWTVRGAVSPRRVA